MGMTGAPEPAFAFAFGFVFGFLDEVLQAAAKGAVSELLPLLELALLACLVKSFLAGARPASKNLQQ